MREIKFRAWSNKRNKYINEVGDFDLVLSLNGDLCINEYGDMIGTSLLELKLEQYTGLKDKNGVDIYEGEFEYDGTTLYTPTLNTHQRNIHQSVGIVEWCEFTLSFVFRFIRSISSHGGFIPIGNVSNGRNKFKVIGNIHEE